jgi:AcrR family transcriptional regulator
MAGLLPAFPANVNVPDTTSKRDMILAAAGRLFDASGYAVTTMEAVAEDAGIAKGSIYNYFRSKHDLFVAVFSQAMATVEAEAERLLAEALPAEVKLDRFIEGWFRHLQHFRNTGRLVLEFWTAVVRERDPASRDMGFAQFHGRWRRRVASLLSQGVESGEFGHWVDPNVGAALLLALMHGLAVQSVLDLETQLDENMLFRLREAVRRTVAPWAEGPPAKESGHVEHA